MTKPKSIGRRTIFVSDFVVTPCFAFVTRISPVEVEKRRRVNFLLCALTSGKVSDSIKRVKWLALVAVLIVECSCTTLANRRDLYSPQPEPNLYWQRQVPITSHEEPASR